jgi:5S rRNA maturation endonuclease (ribonuclease M5)
LTTLEEAMSIDPLRGIEQPINCPSTHHDDYHASASVNVLTGLYVCYACGHAGKAGKGTISESLKAVLALMTGKDPLPTYSEGWLDQFDAVTCSPYWKQRVGEQTATAFRCGTHPFLSTPTYPIRDEHGRVLGVVQRHINPSSPKYLYPHGVPVSKCLFGYEYLNVGTKVLLCEGASDVMAIHSNDIAATAVGSYGAGLHAPQIQLLVNRKPSLVIVGYDNDEAGRRATTTAIRQLRKEGINSEAFTHSAQKKDLAETDAEYIRHEVGRFVRIR